MSLLALALAPLRVTPNSVDAGMRETISHQQTSRTSVIVIHARFLHSSNEQPFPAHLHILVLLPVVKTSAAPEFLHVPLSCGCLFHFLSRVCKSSLVA